MKAYGIPRSANAEYPDMMDAVSVGMPSKVCGRIRNRKATRRIWKKRERGKIKAGFNKYLR